MAAIMKKKTRFSDTNCDLQRWKGWTFKNIRLVWHFNVLRRETWLAVQQNWDIRAPFRTKYHLILYGW